MVLKVSLSSIFDSANSFDAFKRKMKKHTRPNKHAHSMMLHKICQCFTQSHSNNPFKIQHKHQNDTKLFTLLRNQQNILIDYRSFTTNLILLDWKVKVRFHYRGSILFYNLIYSLLKTEALQHHIFLPTFIAK